MAVSPASATNTLPSPATPNSAATSTNKTKGASKLNSLFTTTKKSIMSSKSKTAKAPKPPKPPKKKKEPKVKGQKLFSTCSKKKKESTVPASATSATTTLPPPTTTNSPATSTMNPKSATVGKSKLNSLFTTTRKSIMSSKSKTAKAPKAPKPPKKKKELIATPPKPGQKGRLYPEQLRYSLCYYAGLFLLFLGFAGFWMMCFFGYVVRRNSYPRAPQLPIPYCKGDPRTCAETRDL